MTVRFHVEANKVDTSFRWQWSADGKSWKNSSSSGYNTNTMSFAMKSTFNGRQYRCIVTCQWQWSADGQTWKNCGSAGYNTATMHFVMRASYNGRQYRCNIIRGTEKVTSEAALLIYEKPGIVIDDVVYELIDGMMTVTGYRGSADTVVVLDTVDGHTVTVIGESALEGSPIKSIDLPDTIQLIKKRAFANCSNLTNMT